MSAKWIKVVILTTLLSSTLSGCSKEGVSDTEVVSGTPISCIETSEKINVSSTMVDFEPNETVPVIKDGKVYGFVKVNWVHKINIEDTSNNKASVSGVRHSYAVNMNIDFSKSLSTENLVITPKISLVSSKGEVIGTQCKVGWSGYTTTAQLYDKSPSMNVELTVQPTVNDLSDAKIVISLSDSEHVKYDNIYLSNTYLQQATSVAGVIPAGQEKVITAINGATFGITLVKAEIDKATSSHNDFTSSEAESVYNIYYRVRYISPPVNPTVDLLFDSSNNNALHTKFIISANVSGSPNWLYKGPEKNFHILFHDFSYSELYTTYDFPDIAVGETIECIVCRKVDNAGSNEYLRVAFEFPEEVDARTVEQMRDFDGRYLVFQAPLTIRELGIKPDDYVD